MPSSWCFLCSLRCASVFFTCVWSASSMQGKLLKNLGSGRHSFLPLNALAHTCTHYITGEWMSENQCIHDWKSSLLWLSEMHNRRAADTTQSLWALALLVGEPSLVPSHTHGLQPPVCNSSSRGSDALFLPLDTRQCGTQTYMLALADKIEINKSLWKMNTRNIRWLSEFRVGGLSFEKREQTRDTLVLGSPEAQVPLQCT